MDQLHQKLINLYFVKLLFYIHEKIHELDIVQNIFNLLKYKIKYKI